MPIIIIIYLKAATPQNHPNYCISLTSGGARKVEVLHKGSFYGNKTKQCTYIYVI